MAGVVGAVELAEPVGLAVGAEAAPLHACLDAILARPAWQRGEHDTQDLARDLISAGSRVAAALALVTAGAIEQRYSDDPGPWLAELSPHPLGSRDTRTAGQRATGPQLLPRLTRLHQAGQVSTGYYDAAVRGCHRLPPDVTTVLDAALTEAAPALPVTLVGRLIRATHALLGDHPDGADRAGGADGDAAEPLPSTASLSRYGTEDRYHLTADLQTLAGNTGAALLARLSAPTGPNDTRPAAQRRGAALAQIFRLAANAEGTPTEPGITPTHGLDAHIIVLAHHDTLREHPGSPPAVTADGDTLDPATLAALTCDSPLTTAIGHTPDHPTSPDSPHSPGSSTDSPDSSTELDRLRRRLAGILPVPIGARFEPLHLGRTARLASRAQRLAVILRDRTCRHPGCDRGPRWSHIHHTNEWDADHGHTDLPDLVLLCWEHHTRLHRRHEHLTPNGDGTWTILTQEQWAQRQTQAVA